MPRPQTKPAILTPEQIGLFDELEREEKLARKYRRHASRAKRLREQLDALFGGATVAVAKAAKASESRALLRTSEARHYDPLPERDFEVIRFHEIPVWDL